MGSMDTSEFKEEYGECRDPAYCASKKGCLHLDNPWLGRMCPNWIPTQASSWEELKEIARERYKKVAAGEGVGNPPQAGTGRTGTRP